VGPNNYVKADLPHDELGAPAGFVETINSD
jgi:hypothetical protein